MSQMGNGRWSRARASASSGNASMHQLSNAVALAHLALLYGGRIHFAEHVDLPARHLSMGRAARRGILAAALAADKPVCPPCDIGDLWGVLILGASRQSATSGPIRPTDSVPSTASTMTRPQASHELTC